MFGSALRNIYIVITMQTRTPELMKKGETIPRGKGVGKNHSVSGELAIFPHRKSKESKTEKSRRRSVSMSFINMEVTK